MGSVGRRIRRGKADAFGNPLPKRLYNNKKRTRGRQKQETVKQHHREMMKRIGYIMKLIGKMVADKRELTEENWVSVVREYDSHQLFFDDYEKSLIFQRVNNGY